MMTNTTIRIFESPEFGRMRTAVDKEGNPLFCGKDVCDILGYKKADIAVRQHVNPHDVTKRNVSTPIFSQGSDTGKSKLVQMLFVNESGFYCLVFGSKLPIAQRFKQWVTSVVLPQIRKTGGFIPLNDGESDEETIRKTEEILRKTLTQKEELIAEQKKTIAEKEKLIVQKAAEIIDLEHDVDRLLPKALYSDNVLDSISCYTTTQIAKELGCTAQELNRALCACHIQYYQSGQYLLYADYAHMGLAKSRTRYKAVVEDEDIANGGYGCNGEKTGRIFTHTYLVWTERGRKFIHDLAKRLLDEARLYQQMGANEARKQKQPQRENTCKA